MGRPKKNPVIEGAAEVVALQPIGNKPVLVEAIIKGHFDKGWRGFVSPHMAKALLNSNQIILL